MKIKISETGIIYESIDGAVFESRDECTEHENSIFRILKDKFDKIPHSYMSEIDFLEGAGSDVKGFYLIRPRNIDDIEVINVLFSLYPYESLDENDINEECALYAESLSEGYFVYGCRIYGGIEEYIEMIKTNIHRMRKDIIENY